VRSPCTVNGACWRHGTAAELAAAPTGGRNRFWIAVASGAGISVVGSAVVGTAGTVMGGRPGSVGIVVGSAGSVPAGSGCVTSVGMPLPQWRVSYCGRPRARLANAPGSSYGFGRFVPTVGCCALRICSSAFVSCANAGSSPDAALMSAPRPLEANGDQGGRRWGRRRGGIEYPVG
jgi:hypothetical protein